MAGQRGFRPEVELTASLAGRRARPPLGELLDLSTRFNRYGPPEAVLAALHSLTASDIQLPAAAAADRLEARYAQVLGSDQSELVAGRGTPELLAALAGQVPHGSVAVPLPTSSDILDAFPGRGFPGHPGPLVPSIEQVDAALDLAELVVVSNPHDPTGVLLDPGQLSEAAARHPAATLVVDESGVEFLPYPDAATVVGTDADNVVALRSSSEFYGIGAARAGVAWCRDRLLLRRLFHAGRAWPLSGLDAVAAEAALLSGLWADDARRRLADDASWLTQALQPLGRRVVADRVHAHYRCVLGDGARQLAAGFAAAGVAVAVVGRGQGLSPGAIRVAAPPAPERSTLFAAVEALSSASAWSDVG